MPTSGGRRLYQSRNRWLTSRGSIWRCSKRLSARARAISVSSVKLPAGKRPACISRIKLSGGEASSNSSGIPRASPTAAPTATPRKRWVVCRVIAHFLQESFAILPHSVTLLRNLRQHLLIERSDFWSDVRDFSTLADHVKVDLVGFFTHGSVLQRLEDGTCQL